MTTAPAVARTIPAQARGLGASPRNTDPTATNSGAQLTRVVAAATVVRPREAFQRAKWAARNTPEAARRSRSPRASRPTWPLGANGASTAAPARQRQKARASAGMAATRIRIGEVEMATTPTAIQMTTLVLDATLNRPPSGTVPGPRPRTRRPRPGRRRPPASGRGRLGGHGGVDQGSGPGGVCACCPAGGSGIGEPEAGPAAALDLGAEDVVLQVAPGPAGGQHPVGEGAVADRPAQLGGGPLQQPGPRRLGEHPDRVGPGHGHPGAAADGEVEQQVGVGGVRAAQVRLGRRPGAQVELERRPLGRVGGDRRGDQAELEAGGRRAGQAGMVEAGRDHLLGPPLQRPGDHAQQVDVAALGRPAPQRARPVQVDADQRRPEHPGEARGHRRRVGAECRDRGTPPGSRTLRSGPASTRCRPGTPARGPAAPARPRRRSAGRPGRARQPPR